MADVATLALQAAGGFVTGALVGYALRKAAKVFLTVVGVWLLSIVSLAYVGVVTVNWAELERLVASIVSWLGVETGNIASFVSTAGVFGVTLAAGLFAGMGLLHSVEEPRREERRFVRRKG